MYFRPLVSGLGMIQGSECLPTRGNLSEHTLVWASTGQRVNQDQQRKEDRASTGDKGTGGRE